MYRSSYSRGTVNFNYEFEYWYIFGGKGGLTRGEIIKLLLERPYNAYQIANKLNKSYNNIKYHLRVLMKENLIKSDNRQYSAFYYICKDFDVGIFEKIYVLIKEYDLNKLKRSKIKSFLRRLRKGTIQPV